MIADETDRGWWAPIVYARTRDVDFWWRALPQQMRREGPEALALDATIADDGARTPRFVLARLPSGTLLGVACQTHLISKHMRSDGSRPVPCFIGWLSADPRVAVPQFDAVQAGWGGWAAREYDVWMRDVWAQRDRRVRQTDETAAVPPPWELTGTAPEADVGDRSEFEEPTRAGVRVYPAAEAARVWRGIDRYGVNATVVTGWTSGRTALRPGLTHACAADFHGAMQIYWLPSAKPTRQTQAARPPGIDDPYATAAATYGGSAPAYGGSAPAYGGSAPPETARQHDAAKQPGAGNAAAGDPAAASARSGWRALGKHLVQGAQDLFASGTSGAPAQKQPPAPPSGQLEWTLDLGERVWLARRGEYVYSHRIDEPTIVCWHESAPAEAFQWTGDGWEPLRPAQAPRPQTLQPAPQAPPPAPQAPRPEAAKPEPGQQRPQPTAPGWQPAETPLPKTAGRPAGGPMFTPRIPLSPAHGAPLDEFEDAPLPTGRAVLPDESGYEQDDEQDGQAQTIPPE